MSPAARSLFVYGLYMVASGLAFAIAPNVLLGLAGLPPTAEPWIRVFALLVAVLGLYYVVAARHELTAFFRITVVGRVLMLVGLIALVVLGGYSWRLVLFGVPDQLSALWTWRALGADRDGGSDV
jgi:hypothetical protein